MRSLMILIAAAGLTVTGCGERAPETAPEPVEEISTEGLRETVMAEIPAGAFDSVAVLSLRNPASDVPLWAVHSCGMVNWDMDPQVDHFIAIFTWSDGQWIGLDRTFLSDDNGFPDFLNASGVYQAEITDDFVWLMAEGGAGAHGGTCQLFSFDGERLMSRFSSSFPTPGFAHLENLPADSLTDLVLNYSDPYVFFYASAVRRPDIRVLRWDPLDLEMIEMQLQHLPQTAPEELAQQNDRAVDLAGAGLWMQAMTVLDLVYPAGEDVSERDRWIVDWNYVLVSQNAGMAGSLVDGTYPLLANVFYGDYDAAVDIMRQYDPAEIFTGESPLITGTAAEGWESELSSELVQSSEAALGVEPGLASAWFIRGWGTWLADSTSTVVVEYLTEASELAPDDQLISGSLEYLAGQ